MKRLTRKTFFFFLILQERIELLHAGVLLPEPDRLSFSELHPELDEWHGIRERRLHRRQLEADHSASLQPRHGRMGQVHQKL